MKIEYKGNEIEFVEWEETWHWTKGGSTHKSLKAAKAKIDASLKSRFKTPLKALKPSFSYMEKRPYVEVNVTSESDDGRVWIVKVSDKKRELSDLKWLKADTPNNRKIVEQITEGRNRIMAIEAELSALAESLEPFSLDGAVSETVDAE